MNEMEEKYLAHHGVLGMKWGIRRYQNPDGSLTSAGRKRYGTDLDINDKTRRNVAKIRKGEAYRRLDVAKNNNGTNYTRIAELQGRVRSAKRAERQAKRIDKGAKLQAKGQTIGRNNLKAIASYGAAYAGSKGFQAFLNKRMKDLTAQGRWTPKHTGVAATMDVLASIGMYSAAALYMAKQDSNNRNIRAYQNANRYGQSTLKNIGSTEYADVIKRRSK